MEILRATGVPLAGDCSAARQAFFHGPNVFSSSLRRGVDLFCFLRP